MLNLIFNGEQNADGSYSSIPHAENPVGLLYSENFDSYTPPQTLNTLGNENFTWTGVRQVSSTQSVSGSNSLWFSFGRDQSQGFDLTLKQTELTIEFKIRIPENYYHRDSGVGYEGPNNKFLRLWPDNYTDVEKIGFSTGVQAGGLGESTLLFEFSAQEATEAAPAPQSVIPDFITVGDRGSWINIKMQITAATASSPGSLAFYKNGVLLLERDTVTRGYDELGFGHGYLLGYANTGFAEQTEMYLDDFKISAGIV